MGLDRLACSALLGSPMYSVAQGCLPVPWAEVPRQVSAFSHQLLGRWALECCSWAPWPHSTCHFTHPFLNLILCPFHSSSHAVFTKISPPHWMKHETWLSWDVCGMFPQPVSHQAENHRAATLHHPLQAEGSHLPPWGGGGGVTDVLGNKKTRRSLRKNDFSSGACK